MKKHMYCLNVYFDRADSEVLYIGPSFYRKNLIDQIEICENYIKLYFTRMTECSINDCLYKPMAPTHFEIQRALTFYLAVKGTIPAVKGISLQEGDEEEYLSDLSYTTNWCDCNAHITYEPDVAARIFGEDWRRPYIIMTYFLKAQLSYFSLDEFHAAWSCVNAYYNKFGKPGKDRESEKISKLDYEIRNNKFPLTEQLLKKLKNSGFWNQIQWYNYVSRNNYSKNGERSKLQDWLYDSERFTDRLLFERLVKYVRNPDFTEEQQKEFVSKRLNRYNYKYSVQIAWLICEYCYMLRNRGFHADKPYPLFSLADIGDDKPIEKQLTEIMLLTVYELVKNE